MRRFLTVVGAMAAAGTLAGAGPAQAAIVNWTITGGTLLLDLPDDYGPDVGGAFSGSFSYNTATGAISDWSLQTTIGPSGVAIPPFGETYSSAAAGHAAANDGPGPHFTTPFVGDLSVGHSSDFFITNLDPSLAGSLSNLTGSERFSAVIQGSDLVFTRAITGGNAVGVLAVADVPEPATWALMILGFGMAGAGLRRGRRRTSRLGIGAALAASLTAGSASAATANFQLLGPSNAELLWALDASPIPNGYGIAGFGVTAPIAATSFSGPPAPPGPQAVQITLLRFFASEIGGGLTLHLGATQFLLTGPQVFNGPPSAPTFLAGSYNLSTLFGIPPTNYRLSIVVTGLPDPGPPVTDPVPEPTTWALMILGFGGAGGALRRARAARPA